MPAALQNNPDTLLKMPIGVFDSGLGGLTVLKELSALLPSEDIVYFGDSGRTPYGTKSKDTVIRYTLQDINFLLSHNVKMIVIACNTASACSLDTVSAKYNVPIVEVVGPGARAAARITQNNRVAVIGTSATINSRVYEKALRNVRDNISYIGKACPMFVPLVEEGWWDNKVTEDIIRLYLDDLKCCFPDTLILGCTHYPLLQNTIAKVLGSEISLVNSAASVAIEVKDTLLKNNLLRSDTEKKGKISYYTSDSVEKFAALGSMFLGKELDNVTKIDIDAY
ncbi:MAG: glutamate racemase [Clostridia bacterium]|nr:glutamate racemase [Clostridia bacterium]